VAGGHACSTFTLWSVVLPAAPSPVAGGPACCTSTSCRWPCLLHLHL